MGKATSHYEGALLEEIIHRLKLVQEALGAFKTMPADVGQLKKDMVGVRSDLTVMKAVLTDQSKTLNNHGTRLTKLETA
jgi:hypothetical protein